MSFIEFEEVKQTKETHYLWVEKYRPTTLDNYIGNQQLKDTVGTFFTKGDIPHLLFYGTAGTGKTTLAKAITKNIGCDVMYINASDTNGIDMVRNKIRGFAGSAGFKSLKVIILDECLDENTFVYVLRNGIETKIKIKDVNENEDLIKSFNVKANKIEWRTFYLWDKGEQECVKIELENGESIICTLDHKWYVLNERNVPIKVKTKELFNGKYDHILSPE